MKRSGFNFLLAGLITFFAIPRSLFAQPEPLPKFDEVYQLLLTNSSGLTETELNRAAVKGLLAELHSRVALVTNISSSAATNSESLSKISVHDGAFAYFRLGKIESGLNEKLHAAHQKILSTNKLKGVVLDLRYAGGTDYAAAAKTADLFLNSDQMLLRWGDTSARATKKTNAIAVPVAILVNHQTSGAAEALAGILRETQVGLVVGTNTAGQASLFKEFKLTNGQILKIASAPVKLGNGNEIPHEGLKPDIEILVSDAEEKTFFENPYRMIPKPVSLTSTDTNSLTSSSETNRPRRRINEAELVRLQREGLFPNQEFSDERPKEVDPAKPTLSDPSLVRALDLLKGLAIVQQSRRN